VQTLSRIWTAALDLVYPPRCFGCNKEGSFLCPECVGRLPRTLSPRCERCWQSSKARLCEQCHSVEQWIDGIRSPFRHEEVAREAVLQLKYNGVSAAGLPMGELLGSSAKAMPVETIVPVPLHRSRRRKRGYNQAEMLADGLRQALGLPVEPDLLKRRKATREQAAGLGYDERLANVEGAFIVPDGAAIDGRSILLVDDVVTTGATMQSCARALKQAGAAAVYGVSFTREG
jgi:ComF family protein